MGDRRGGNGEPGRGPRFAGWLLPGAVALALLLLVPGPAGASRPLKEGEAVPDMVLRDLAGASHSLGANKGRAVILCFFRSEQDKSVKALNDIARIFGAFRERSLVAFAISFPAEDKIEDVRALQGKLGLSYPVLLDEGRKFQAALGIGTIPTTLLVDPEGRLALETVSYGADFEAVLTQRIRETLGLLAEGPGNGKGGKGEPAPVGTPEAREAERELSLAQILYQRGFLARALPEAEKAMQKDPGLVAARLLMGQILLEGGKPEAARPHFEAVLEKKRDSWDARVGLGTSLFLTGDLDRAEAELLQAATGSPSPGVALYRLGQVYEKRGQKTQALETFRRACEELIKRASRGD